MGCVQWAADVNLSSVPGSFFDFRCCNTITIVKIRSEVLQDRWAKPLTIYQPLRNSSFSGGEFYIFDSWWFWCFWSEKIIFWTSMTKNATVSSQWFVAFKLFTSWNSHNTHIHSCARSKTTPNYHFFRKKKHFFQSSQLIKLIYSQTIDTVTLNTLFFWNVLFSDISFLFRVYVCTDNRKASSKLRLHQT